ncbi:hypothetical protein CDD82_3210 [Ophiocordyceps australis]|uniref:Uncharacterized protein n=1 Tax=Ophiocordyceps australis TaxID=1399860 RepID=A0A2C5ZFV8_9HYPO|nr:hypothetical protein CDD82_3210 [Ophiocordyceps australis]
MVALTKALLALTGAQLAVCAALPEPANGVNAQDLTTRANPFLDPLRKNKYAGNPFLNGQAPKIQADPIGKNNPFLNGQAAKAGNQQPARKQDKETCQPGRTDECDTGLTCRDSRCYYPNTCTLQGGKPQYICSPN